MSQDGESWRRRYYAGFKDGKHYAWRIGCTSWSTVELDDFDNNTVIHKVPWEYMKLAEEEE